MITKEIKKAADYFNDTEVSNTEVYVNDYVNDKSVSSHGYMFWWDAEIKNAVLSIKTHQVLASLMILV